MSLDVVVPAKLDASHEESLALYCRDRIRDLNITLKELFEEKVVKWNAAYEARPAEQYKQFPFQNASNIVIPIIAIHTDTLHAQLMAAIFRTRPLVETKIYGEPNERLDKLREAYQEFMEYVAVEPEELDLYRVYNEGFKQCIKFGTTTFKVVWEEVVRDFNIPAGDGTGSLTDFIPETTFSGPRPEALPFTSFLIPPACKRIEDSDFVAHRRKMSRYEIEERVFRGVYDKEKAEIVLKTPDRTSPEFSIKAAEDNLGTYEQPRQEWDIYEIHMTWHFEDHAPRVIVTYHYLTNTVLRVVFDNFRSNWFVGARLLSRDDLYFGYGFAEALWYFQEGASETYNGFRDNQTIANTRVWRVSPDSKLNIGYRIYPSATIPAEKDEIEPMAHGDLGQVNIQDLQLLLELAERRSGVSPPQQGFGAGVTTGRRGVYSAMGTLALLQEGNTRKDLLVSDMRDAHTRVMRLVTKLYDAFGEANEYHERRLAKFGQRAELIRDAIKEIVAGTIAIPVYSSTASVNREVEKQNDMLLTQVMARHYGSVSQLLGAMTNPMTPPEVKDYMASIIKASNALMKTLLRNFGHDDVDILVPEPKQNVLQRTPQQGASPNAGMVGGPQGQGLLQFPPNIVRPQ